MKKKNYGQIADELRVIMRAMEIKPDEPQRVWYLACAHFGEESLDVWCVSALIAENCTKLPRTLASFS